MTQTRWKWIVRILMLGTIMAALKIIFFDYTMDEEYQIMMSYRNLEGDHLFKEMWEPHQTSAFLCTGLMWLYKSVTGTYTGILIYLRICTTLVQVGISYYLYRVLMGVIRKEYAFLCGLIYFNLVPKIIQIPEFSNMQLWFFTLLVLLLIQYYRTQDEKRKSGMGLLILAGVSMALEVLSYPSCLICFPFFVGYIGIKSGKGNPRKGWRDAFVFMGTCAACAVIWLLIILRNVTFSEFVRNVKYMLDFDLTHELSGATSGKGAGILNNLAGGMGLLLLTAILSLPVIWIIRRRSVVWSRQKGLLVAMTVLIFVAELIQMFFWVVQKSGYEKYQFHVLLILLCGLVSWRYAGEKKIQLSAGIIGTILSIGAVVYISDLEMYYALPHGVLGVIFCAVMLVMALEKALEKEASKWSYFLLVCFCLISIFGKGYTLRDGRDYNVVLDTESIMRHGPAVGVMSDYMNAYIYNCNYEDFGQYVTAEDTVLIVTNTVFSESTTPYMMVGADVAHYSIVDPTAYDERLLTYWELYPEKEPNVIVVDCWYGGLLEDPDSWIMQYVEKDFGYTRVDDGRYVRFYRK